jgi:hypothetical protein
VGAGIENVVKTMPELGAKFQDKSHFYNNLKRFNDQKSRCSTGREMDWYASCVMEQGNLILKERRR